MLIIIVIDARVVARSKNVGWTRMASVEREPITGVCRVRSPQRIPGAESLVRGEASPLPLKLKTF